MEKVTAIRIKQPNNMILSDEIPIGVSVQNVDWDSSNNLKQVLGNVDIDNKGDIQQQIDNISSLMTVPDSELSSSSTNAIQNKVVKQALDKKADKTTIPKNISELTNDAGFLTSTTAPVTSVNGYTGEVSINLSDLGGLDRINDLEDRIAELENTSGGDDDDQSITIDSELLDSQNPVQNRAIKTAFDEVDSQLNHINQVLSGNSAAITAHEDRIDALELRPTGGSITIDNVILTNSTNPVQNRVIKEALDTKADLSEIPVYTSQLTNDSGFLTSAPVTKVNGQTGDVVIPQASTSVSGLMAAADKVMLNRHDDQIQQLKASSGSSSIAVDSALSDTSTNPVQNKIIKQALDSKAGISVATTSTNGLMSSTDKTTLDSYESRITALENSSGSSSGETPTITIDSALSSTSVNPVQNKVITQALNSKADNSIVNTNSSGLMSAQDKIQLNDHEDRIDLIENTLSSGSVVTVDETLSTASRNPVQNRAITQALNLKASNDLASESESGLMSAQDKVKLNNYDGRIDLIENLLSSGSIITIDEALSGTSQNPVQNKVIKAALDLKAGTSLVSSSAAGLMSSADKTKLDGYGNRITSVQSAIEANNAFILGYEDRLFSVENSTVENSDSILNLDNFSNSLDDRILSIENILSQGQVTPIDSSLSSTSQNPVQNKVIKAALDLKAGTNVVSSQNNGLMSSTDKTKLDSHDNTLTNHQGRISALENSSSGGGGSTFVGVDSALSDISTNPVQNKVIKQALDAKADLTLVNTKADLTLVNTKADLTAIPTKTSQLTNDSGFVTTSTKIPIIYVNNQTKTIIIQT